MSELNTLPDTQSPNVGKTKKSEPAVSGRKSLQRRYEDVRLGKAHCRRQSRECLFPYLVKTEK
ncbi:MAG: hypothetical protein SAK29_11785 [Scytonema sp. PMC 1069.18]|nr:hypothetical protein [Scytonema sp. PMC 1069.18]MEC4880923.1 hypothetical protein [Scytonema sp. PMC 1070.18]